MEKWELSKEEIERCKKEAVAKAVDKFFPDITNGEKKALCEFFEELFNEFMVSERNIYLEKEKKDKGNGYSKTQIFRTLRKLDLPYSNKFGREKRNRHLVYRIWERE